MHTFRMLRGHVSSARYVHDWIPEGVIGGLRSGYAAIIPAPIGLPFDNGVPGSEAEATAEDFGTELRWAIHIGKRFRFGTRRSPCRPYRSATFRKASRTSGLSSTKRMSAIDDEADSTVSSAMRAADSAGQR